MVTIQGLVKRPELNGRVAIILAKSKSSERWETAVNGGRQFASLKPQNITEYDPDVNSKKHKFVELWPEYNSDDIERKSLISEIPGWPPRDDWALELKFLKEKLGWKNPQTVTGITSKGRAKPDWAMYFDAAETKADVNIYAEALIQHLPQYELVKWEDPVGGEIRGSVVLIYSPMVSGGVWCSEEGKLWSLQDLQEKLVHYHLYENCANMYKEHDNPYHRMFGAHFDNPTSSLTDGGPGMP